MGCLNFLIIAVLAYFVGGPVGVIITLAILMLFSSKIDIRTGNFKQRHTDTEIKEYLESIIMIFSNVAMYDGKVTKEEVQFVKEFLSGSFPGNIQFVSFLMDRFRFYNENPSSVDVKSAIDMLNRKVTNSNERFSLYSILVRLAFLSSNKKAVKNRLKEIGLMLKLKEYEIDSLFNYYEHNAQESREGTTDDAYETLDLNPEATDEEFKRRYKDLVKIYHPDKLRNMPESFQKESEEKLKTINAAYAKIKNYRGL